MILKNFSPYLAFGLLITLLSTGCVDNGGDNSTSEGGSTVVASSSGAKVGSHVPDFLLKRIDGGTLQLSSLQGKAVLIDFWDTWCPPCIAAMPHLEEISNTYKGDLVVVGIAFGRNGEGAVAKFVRDNGLTFEFVMADKKVISDFGGLSSIPTTFLVDENGLVVQKWVGGQPKSIYEDAVKATLGS